MLLLSYMVTPCREKSDNNNNNLDQTPGLELEDYYSRLALIWGTGAEVSGSFDDSLGEGKF